MAVQLPKIQTYTWKGLNKRGQKIDGEINSTSIALAKAELRRQGISPTRVSRKTNSLFTKRKQKIKSADIAVFSRQLATMITAGIPLVQALDIIGKGSANNSLQEMVNKIKADVESGTQFSQALSKFPIYFNDLYCNLVDAGEQSGSLDGMLNRVATYREKIESLKAKIKKALFYPLIVVFVAIVVTVGLLIFVIPQFESLFKSFGADLPALTQGVIKLSQFFQAYWWILLGGVIATGWLSYAGWQRSEKFQNTVQRILLKMPVIGVVLQKAAIARFARTLAITFAAGLPLVDALRTVSGATGNTLYRDATLKIRDEVSTGQQLQTAMRATHLFPAMAIQMVGIGEESGSLELMLNKIADFYEEEVDNVVANLSTLLEPAIMVFLGVIVGGLVIAMYLPIFKLGSVV